MESPETSGSGFSGDEIKNLKLRVFKITQRSFSRIFSIAGALSPLGLIGTEFNCKN
jgi:hypothetical protein